MVDHLKGRWPLNLEEMENGLAETLRAMFSEYDAFKASRAHDTTERDDAIARAMGWRR